MGLNIDGKVMIFKNKFGYSTTISRKTENEYERMYVAIQLPKGVELENQTKINITNGFLSFYKDKNGLAKIKIVVMEFETEDSQDDDLIENFGQDLPF